MHSGTPNRASSRSCTPIVAIHKLTVSIFVFITNANVSRAHHHMKRNILHSWMSQNFLMFKHIFQCSSVQCIKAIKPPDKRTIRWIMATARAKVYSFIAIGRKVFPWLKQPYCHHHKVHITFLLLLLFLVCAKICIEGGGDGDREFVRFAIDNI